MIFCIFFILHCLSSSVEHNPMCAGTLVAGIGPLSRTCLAHRKCSKNE